MLSSSNVFNRLRCSNSVCAAARISAASASAAPRHSLSLARWLSASSSSAVIDVNKIELAEEKPPSAEYHRHSTRYSRCSRAVLNVLDKEWRLPEHPPLETGSDYVAVGLVKWLRRLSDAYFQDRLLLRATALEVIAGTPGFVAGMTHHFRSLRQMKHCYWLKAVAAEAENERMHLMTFMKLTMPTLGQRLLILVSQAVFMSIYLPAYVIFPRTSHRFVSALEVEACHTYTEMLAMIDSGRIPNCPAPQIAKDYWNLPEDATLRDVVLVVRADEADHILVNHYMSDSFKFQRSMTVNNSGKPCDSFDLDLHEPFGPIFLPGHKQHYDFEEHQKEKQHKCTPSCSHNH